MALPFNYDDSSREALPSIWVFRGSSVLFLLGGFALFLLSFQVLKSVDVDFFPNLCVSLLPMGFAVGLVVFLVNGKAPSYAICFFDWAFLRLSFWLYSQGILDRAPLLWRIPKSPIHPLTFDQKPT